MYKNQLNGGFIPNEENLSFAIPHFYYFTNVSDVVWFLTSGRFKFRTARRYPAERWIAIIFGFIVFSNEILLASES